MHWVMRGTRGMSNAYLCWVYLLFWRVSKTAKSNCKLFSHCSAVHCSLPNPTGHVMHPQFNIQQLYALPTPYLCVLYLSENKQRLVPLTA